MLAVYVSRPNCRNPLAALRIGERPEPPIKDGWALVHVKSVSLNHHDLFSLRGVGLPTERMPMILGTDAAGVDDQGNEVIVHAVITNPTWRGDETLDPDRTILSEFYQGTFAQKLVVPQRNLIPKPKELSFAEAACLPSAWLTAYRMLFVQSGLRPGQTVLIQGASGGVSTALITLASKMGLEVWVTSRSDEGRRRAIELGANQVFTTGSILPQRVDGVMETVGAATWNHSLRVLKSGGAVVISGATTGIQPPASLDHIFFRQLRVIGSTMGTRSELESLVQLCLIWGIRPPIAQQMRLDEARNALNMLANGNTLRGKLTLTVSD